MSSKNEEFVVSKITFGSSYKKISVFESWLYKKRVFHFYLEAVFKVFAL